MTRPDPSAKDPSFNDMIEVARAVPIEQLIGKYVKLTRSGREFKACCPFHRESTPSFTVVPDKNLFHCFGCGASGDGLSFVQRIDGTGFKESVRAICATFGYIGGTGIKSPARPRDEKIRKEQEQKADARKLSRMHDIWMASGPAKGTIVEEYMISRGIDLSRINPDVLFQLRFVRTEYFEQTKNGMYVSRGFYPAMLAPFQDKSGRIVGLHLTYLKDDGSGKLILIETGGEKELPSKKMLGTTFGCAIRLGKAAPIMAVAEGIETGLSFMMARDDISVWIAGSVGNICGRGVGDGAAHPDDPLRKLPSVYPDHAHPGLELPKECRHVYIVKDNDGKDQRVIDCLIERASRRFYQRMMRVSLITPPPGMDLNDVVRVSTSGGVHAVS